MRKRSNSVIFQKFQPAWLLSRDKHGGLTKILIQRGDFIYVFFPQVLQRCLLIPILEKKIKVSFKEMTSFREHWTIPFPYDDVKLINALQTRR